MYAHILSFALRPDLQAEPGPRDQALVLTILEACARIKARGATIETLLSYHESSQFGLTMSLLMCSIACTSAGIL